MTWLCMYLTSIFYLCSPIYRLNPLRIVDKSKSHTFYLNASMPEDLRLTAADSLSCLMHSFPKVLKPIDSRKEGINHSRPAIHMSFYNRMREDGSEAPTDQSPYFVRKFKDGKEIRMNYMQVMPTEACEKRDFITLCNDLMDAFRPVFEFLAGAVSLSLDTLCFSLLIFY